MCSRQKISLTVSIGFRGPTSRAFGPTQILAQPEVLERTSSRPYEKEASTAAKSARACAARESKSIRGLKAGAVGAAAQP